MGVEIEFAGGYLFDGHWRQSAAAWVGWVCAGTVGPLFEAAAGGFGRAVDDVDGVYEGGQGALCIGKGA
jgi:hypothetical protein